MKGEDEEQFGTKGRNTSVRPLLHIFAAETWNRRLLYMWGQWWVKERRLILRHTRAPLRQNIEQDGVPPVYIILFLPASVTRISEISQHT